MTTMFANTITPPNRPTNATALINVLTTLGPKFIGSIGKQVSSIMATCCTVLNRELTYVEPIAWSTTFLLACN